MRELKSLKQFRSDVREGDLVRIVIDNGVVTGHLYNPPGEKIPCSIFLTTNYPYASSPTPGFHELSWTYLFSFAKGYRIIERVKSP